MTFTTPTVNVYGIPSGVPTRFEYTNQAMADEYSLAIQGFVNVLSVQGALNLTSANQNAVNSALLVLTNLAKYGIIVTTGGQVFHPTSPISPAYLAANGLSNDPAANLSTYSQFFMTMTMAQNYDQILRSLAAVGVDVNAAGNLVPSVTLEQLQRWRDLAVQVSSVAGAVRAAQIEGVAGAKNLQNMIEVDYVQTGNEIISNNMAQLKSALNITQQILDNLAVLQNIHNQITTRVSVFNFNYQDPNQPGVISSTNAHGPSVWAPAYQTAASAYFGRNVVPVLISSIDPGAGANYQSAFQSLVAVRERLKSEFHMLSVITSETDRNNPTSLYSRVKQVLEDLKNNFTDSQSGGEVSAFTPGSRASAGFKKWMLDNYASFNSAGMNKAGGFQQNITFAITSAENLNDTQKETVRNYLFIFEEYYKSASAALQAITQIIQKMAQNIAR